MLGVQCLDSSSGEEIQGVPFATGQSRSLEDQRNSLVQKQPAGSFRSEVGTGLSKIPGCLLRATKILRKKRSGGRGAQPGQEQQDVIPTRSSSPLLLPWTPTPAGASRAAPGPPTFPGHRDELELLHRHNPWRDQTLLNTWPGLQEKGKSPGEALLDQCCLEKEFPRATGQGRDPVPRLGLGTPWTHIRAHTHSLCPCNTTQ